MQGYSALIQHYARHVKELASMPNPPPEFQGLQDLLKAHQRTFSQLTRVANANAQRAQKQMQKQQQEQAPQGGPTPDEQATLIRAQGEVAIKTRSAQVDDAIKLRKAGLQAEIKNTAGAQKLQANDLLTSQKLAVEKAKEVRELAAADAAPTE
jgi:hypothetical protein